MPYAIKVTEKSIPQINRIADLVGMDLSYIPDELQYHAEDGHELFLVKDGKIQDHNITFTTMRGDAFSSSWKFIEAANSTGFAKIEEV